MMKKKVIILSVILVAIIGIITVHYLNNRKAFVLDLKIINNKNISLKMGNKDADIVESKDENIVIDVLNKKRKTFKDSVSDYPVGGFYVIEINVTLSNDSKLILYAYEKNKKYYLEKPYDGIYDISKDEYDSIFDVYFKNKI